MEKEAIKRKRPRKFSISAKLFYYSDVSIDNVVENLRKYVLVILTFKIILLFLYFGFKMYHLVQYAGFSTLVRENSITIAMSLRLALTCVDLVFFIIFFIFVVRYNSLGTQICTWLTIIDLALNVTSLVFTIGSLIKVDIITNMTLIIIVIVILIFSILSNILLIAFGFQYTNSIEIQNEYQRV